MTVESLTAYSVRERDPDVRTPFDAIFSPFLGHFGGRPPETSKQFRLVGFVIFLIVALPILLSAFGTLRLAFSHSIEATRKNALHAVVSHPSDVSVFSALREVSETQNIGLFAVSHLAIDEGIFGGLLSKEWNIHEDKAFRVIRSLTHDISRDELLTKALRMTSEWSLIHDGARAILLFPLSPADESDLDDNTYFFTLDVTDSVASVLSYIGFALLIAAIGVIAFVYLLKRIAILQHRQTLSIFNSREKARLTAEHLAYFDEVTGLPNRSACIRDAGKAFDEANDDKPAFLMHLVIGNISRVSRTFGIVAGEVCVKKASEQLLCACGGLGKVYRWSGDEFVVIASNAVSDPEPLCERLQTILHAPIDCDGHQVWPTITMGIARCPKDGTSFDELLAHADLALVNAEKFSSDRWTYFTADMRKANDAETRMEEDLHLAIERDELFLVFQPQENIRTQTTTGIEALLRWQHPEHGVISPGVFLPVAERGKLGIEISHIVLDKAFQAIRELVDRRISFGRLAINVMPAHLASGELVDDILERMARYKVGPELITIEVLETVIFDSVDRRNIDQLKTLYDMGIHIELDDFGTGYASLSQLTEIPVNGLKVDRCFIQNMTTDPKKLAIVDGVIKIARALEMNIICEGVETDAQYKRLADMGDFSAQGYYISRPVPFEDLCDWLSAGQNDLIFQTL